MRLRHFHLIVSLLICAACQDVSDNSTPTSAPTATEAPALAVFPTRENRSIATHQAPTLTFTPSPLPTLTRIAGEPDSPLLATSPEPAPTEIAALSPAVSVIGTSVEGRAITARRLGEGTRVLMLVGGIHGGWEANTVRLIGELTAHFEAQPDDIQPGVALVLVAALNPDGLPYGRSEAGRFNANGVDLNRNWGCDWSPDAVWRSQAVDAGATAFSEPETLALAEYIRGLRPAAVVFYHSAANGVYPGACDSADSADSEALAAALGEAAGYRYGQPFSAYRVTGTAPNWVDGLGIPSVDVELRTWTETEFEQNLRGVLAAQRWLIEGE